MKVGDAKTLVSNLGNKINYVIHYKNLQFIYKLEWNWVKFNKFWNLSNPIGCKNLSILTLRKEKILLIALKNIFFRLMISSVYGRKWKI